MHTQSQLQILQTREIILGQLEKSQGTLNERMKGSVDAVQNLGRMVNQWIDEMAVKYRSSGMELEEWFDDVVHWLQTNQFMVEEIESIPLPTGFDKCVMHCHLSNEGLGRHVVMKFTLLR